MSNSVIFRPRSGLVFFTLAAIGASIYTYQSFRYFSFESGVTTLIWSALIMVTGYLIFIRPKVEIYDEGITIVNPLYTIECGWQDVIAIDVRYTMSIRVRYEVKPPFHRRSTDNIHAFAAPAPGRYHSRHIHPTEIRGVGIDHTVALRPGDSPRSHSGQAAAIARLRIAEFEKRAIARRVEFRLDKNTLGQSILIALLLLIAFDVAI